MSADNLSSLPKSSLSSQEADVLNFLVTEDLSQENTQLLQGIQIRSSLKQYKRNETTLSLEILSEKGYLKKYKYDVEDFYSITLGGLLVSKYGARCCVLLNGFVKFLSDRLDADPKFYAYSWAQIKEDFAIDSEFTLFRKLIKLCILDNGGGSGSPGAIDFTWSRPRDIEILTDLNSTEKIIAYVRKKATDKEEQDERDRQRTQAFSASPFTERIPSSMIASPSAETEFDIFLVHGQNHKIRDKIAEFLREECRLRVNIMDAQPNKGQTVAEKLDTNGPKCKFAVVLLTADDLLLDSVNNEVVRARQNVFIEVGYFWGLLGRKNLAILVENPKKMEIPSDLGGIVYISIDGNLRKTKKQLFVELKGAGLVASDQQD